MSLLKAEPNGAPYGVQIFGEVPEIMGEATAAIEQYEFDFVDINMGCPAPKIVSGGAGSKLMLDPDRCGRIVEQVVANTKRPVTVKMRKAGMPTTSLQWSVPRPVSRPAQPSLRCTPVPGSRCTPPASTRRSLPG